MFPSHILFLNQVRNQTMSSQLLRAINLARNEAILRGKDVILCKSADFKTCSGSWNDGFIIMMEKKVLFTFPNKDNRGELHWRAFPNHQDYLRFYPTGLTHFEHGTFWYSLLHTSKACWSIIINQSGRSRLAR